MRAPRVGGLVDQGSRSGIVLVIICQSLMRDDRIRKVFVEIAGLKQTGIIEGALVEYVVMLAYSALSLGFPTLTVAGVVLISG